LKSEGGQGSLPIDQWPLPNVYCLMFKGHGSMIFIP
jgi:hypothetical protein